VARRGYEDRPVADDRMLSAGEGLVGQAIRTGQSQLVRDVWRAPYYVVGRPQTLSELVVPILFEGRGIAALNVESDRLAAFDESDLERLEFFAEAAGTAIEKAMLHRRLVELEQVGAQVRLAREVQLGLLPRAAPELPGWEISGLCRPSLELGGDLYDHFPLDPLQPAGTAQHGLVIGDVAGKGVPAALIMATFRALLRARREPQEIADGGRGGAAATVAAVSRLLRESTATRAFVTCCYVLLEPASGEIVYASCGHPPALLARAGGDGRVVKLEELENCGPALGAFEHESFVERRATLQPGDCLLLFTDGLTEALNPEGEAFGIERVRAAFAELAGRQEVSAVRIADELVRRVVDFVASEHLADDLTLVVSRRLT
jgi:sigma-B regulation protein RsbU (phosphoserine phosphatase)